MSSFHKRYFLNKDVAENGNWIDFGDGLAVCVRRANSMHTQATRKRLDAEYQHRKDADGEYPEDVVNEIGRRVMAESIIIGWKGVADENGEEIACTPENICKVLTLYEDFGTEVFQASVMRTNFQKVVREADLGN